MVHCLAVGRSRGAKGARDVSKPVFRLACKHRFEACTLSLLDLPRFFLVEFLVGVGRREGLDKRFVLPLDFACTDEWALTPLPLDRLLPVHLREELLKLRDSETERLIRRLDAVRHGLDRVMVVVQKAQHRLPTAQPQWKFARCCCNAITHTCARRVHARQVRTGLKAFTLEQQHRME